MSGTPSGCETTEVQTGNIVYRINRAHGLHCGGKEESADASEGNQCHESKDTIDGRLAKRRLFPVAASRLETAQSLGSSIDASEVTKLSGSIGLAT